MIQLDVPDPAASSRTHFRLSLRIAFTFVAVLWLIHGLAAWLELDPQSSGIWPRQWAGLPGILFAPLVHGSFEHLVDNSAPLLVAGTAMVYLYPRSVLRVFPSIWLGPGVAVWLFGRESVHFGASGLVYGLASYVLAAGLLRRDRRAVAASMIVWFLYGSLVWGVLPVPHGISWETHLAAALIGIAWAIALRRLDVPRRKRYGWEGAVEDEDEDEEQT